MDSRQETEANTDNYRYQQTQSNYQIEIVKPELDLNYLKTLPGMLKCTCITLDFICFICLAVGGSAYYPGAGWIIFICLFGMLISVILLILYLFRIVDLIRGIPWIVCEMIIYFAWAIFFFICGCVLTLVATQFRSLNGYGAAAFFSFGALCAYGFDSYLKFLSWRHDEIATGGAPLQYLQHRDTTIPNNEERLAIR
uniref:MARVEL domain-containing protein n=1 Tax=Setaria digitata TaxID=48799 RepID=A0A915PP59_9BILA